MRRLMVLMSTLAGTMSHLMIWMNSLIIGMRPLVNFMRRLIKQPNLLMVLMSVLHCRDERCRDIYHGGGALAGVRH